MPDQRQPGHAKRVMVVHGRNDAARDSMFAFLAALGLDPIDWEEAVAETGEASPHNLVAVRAAMDSAQVVVVIFTAEDEARLIDDLREEADRGEEHLQGQPRPNVLFEAGLAWGLDHKRTILVEIGQIRRASDLDGLNAVQLNDTEAKRHALKRRLSNAGCDVDDGVRFLQAGTFGVAVTPSSDAPRDEQSNTTESRLALISQLTRERVSAASSVPERELGVHVFLVGGLAHDERDVLIRVARSTRADKAASPRLKWSRNDGVVGECWRATKFVSRNLKDPEYQKVGPEEWESRRSSGDPFCMGMTFEEFHATDWFSSVFVYPVKGPAGFRGCVSLDADDSVDGSYEALLAASVENELRLAAFQVQLVLNEG